PFGAPCARCQSLRTSRWPCKTGAGFVGSASLPCEKRFWCPRIASTNEVACAQPAAAAAALARAAEPQAVRPPHDSRGDCRIDAPCYFMPEAREETSPRHRAEPGLSRSEADQPSG